MSDIKVTPHAERIADKLEVYNDDFLQTQVCVANDLIEALVNAVGGKFPDYESMSDEQHNEFEEAKLDVLYEGEKDKKDKSLAIVFNYLGEPDADVNEPEVIKVVEAFAAHWSKIQQILLHRVMQTLYESTIGASLQCCFPDDYVSEVYDLTFCSKMRPDPKQVQKVLNLLEEITAPSEPSDETEEFWKNVQDWAKPQPGDDDQGMTIENHGTHYSIPRTVMYKEIEAFAEQNQVPPQCVSVKQHKVGKNFTQANLYLQVNQAALVARN